MRSSIASRKMVPLVLLWLSTSLALPAAASDSGWYVGQKLRANVVRLEVSASGKTRNGFGFVVAERADADSAKQQLVVVTADHVVRGKAGEAAAETIQVAFFESDAQPATATLHEAHLDRDHGDIAVLLVDKPQGFGWVQACWDTREIAPPEPVRYVGRNRQWTIPPDPLKVMSRRAADQQLELQGDVQRGTSGAPLLSEKGFVGIVVEDATGSVFATEAGAVKKFLDGHGLGWLAPMDEDQRTSWLLEGTWKARKGETDTQVVLTAEGTLDERTEEGSVLGLEPGEQIRWEVRGGKFYTGVGGEEMGEWGQILEVTGDGFLVKTTEQPVGDAGGASEVQGDDDDDAVGDDDDDADAGGDDDDAVGDDDDDDASGDDDDGGETDQDEAPVDPLTIEFKRVKK